MATVLAEQCRKPLQLTVFYCVVKSDLFLSVYVGKKVHGYFKQEKRPFNTCRLYECTSFIPMICSFVLQVSSHIESCVSRSAVI